MQQEEARVIELAEWGSTVGLQKEGNLRSERCSLMLVFEFANTFSFAINATRATKE